MALASPTSLLVCSRHAYHYFCTSHLQCNPFVLAVLTAIQFVLDTNYAVLRVEDRKLLLHEGVGAQVLSAFVEIVLDNADRRMPIDRDEAVIRRAIGLKKDEYFIERKHCSKNEARQMIVWS